MALFVAVPTAIAAELDSMRIMQAGMEGENQKMRRIISVYIQSSELNEPAWEVMEEDDVAGVYTSMYIFSVDNICSECIYFEYAIRF